MFLELNIDQPLAELLAREPELRASGYWSQDERTPAPRRPRAPIIAGIQAATRRRQRPCDGVTTRLAREAKQNRAQQAQQPRQEQR